MSELLDAIALLPVPEQLRLVEQVIERIKETEQVLPISNSIRDEIRRRVADINEDEYLMREEMWRRVGRSV